MRFGFDPCHNSYCASFITSSSLPQFYHQVDASFIGCFSAFHNILQRCADQGDQSWPRTGLAVHRCSLFCHNHWEAASACWHMSVIARLLAIPVMPSMLKALHSDCPAKPLLPTSTGRFQVSHLCCLHSSINAWYLAFFLSCASSILSSHGTVSSRRTIYFVILDSSKISGRSFVLAISAGNFSCFFKSTRRSQSLAVVRSPVDLRLLVTEPPFFTKLINVGYFSL